MLTAKQSTPFMILTFTTITIFYGWMFIFQDNLWLKAVGSSTSLMIASLLSFIWLYKAYRVNHSQGYFWLFLSLGASVHFLSNLSWLIQQLITNQTNYSDVSYLLWFLANLFFLSAIIYKIYKLKSSASNKAYFFNIVVLLTTAITISINYLIKPILELANDSIFYSLITLAYPITDLTILFVVTQLYYLSIHSKEKNIITIIVIGFIIQIAADTYFAYLTTNGHYQVGSFVDLMYVFQLLFIGFAGLESQKESQKLRWEIYNPFYGRESIFPYISILTLITLVSYDYDWQYNTLSVGLLLVILMVIGRQLIIMRKNINLVNEYRHLAYHDPLTGLRNRTSFISDLDKIMMVSLNRHERIAVFLIDLDRFKNINDTLGHYIGDTLLKETAQRIITASKGHDLIYRLGGDEFVIIVTEANEKKCIELSNKLIDRITNPFRISSHEISISPSIGISLFPENGFNSESMYKAADAAMYYAKSNGRSNFQFYNPDLHVKLTRKMKIENELRMAIERKQLVIFYQPKVDLLTREIVGMEALLRWDHPELGIVSPSEFIPIAEETGQIVTIGNWVLHEACEQNVAWQRAEIPPLSISVNVSVRQFEQNNFVETVKSVLNETSLDPSFLELEITESILQNVETSIEILKQLRAIGVEIAIDDFGTGYSSLHILKELPIDTIKIDKSFIDDIQNGANQFMFKTIINIGANLNLKVVAEGIELEEQALSLAEYNCLIGQGFLFLKPVQREVFERHLKESFQEKKRKELTHSLSGC